MVNIVAIDKTTGEREKINDLYWFEENTVHSFDDDYRYDFEILINDVMVYNSKVKCGMDNIVQNCELNYWNAKKILERMQIIMDELKINTR